MCLPPAALLSRNAWRLPGREGFMGLQVGRSYREPAGFPERCLIAFFVIQINAEKLVHALVTSFSLNKWKFGNLILASRR